MSTIGTQTPAISGKRARIETLLRVLAFVVIVTSAIGEPSPDATWPIGIAIGYLAWIVISTAAVRVGALRTAAQSFWVVAIDMLLIGLAITQGRTILDELCLMACMVPIGIMTLRGKLVLAVVFAAVATWIAYSLLGDALRDPNDPTRDVQIEVVAHTFAWLAIFGLVAFSSQAGLRFLRASELQETEVDQNLDALLERVPEMITAKSRKVAIRLITEIAREVFKAESASVLERRGENLQLAGLSRLARYVDPEEEGETEDRSEASTRVSIGDYVAYTQQPLLLNDDLSQDPRFRNLPPRAGVHSAMCVPILCGGELFGVLNVTQLDPRTPQFTPSDLRVARVLGHVGAYAVSRHPSS